MFSNITKPKIQWIWFSTEQKLWGTDETRGDAPLPISIQLYTPTWMSRFSVLKMWAQKNYPGNRHQVAKG